MNWLKKRFTPVVKEKYLLNEKELKEQKIMKKIFKNIDRD